MNRLRVGVDIDGVLAEFVPSAREVAKKLFNGRPDDNLIQRSWSFDSIGITKDEENLLWKTIDETPNWWTTLDRCAGASTLKMKLLMDKCMVIFITNRKDGVVGLPIEQQSQIFLKDKFHIYNPTVLIMNDKGPLLNALKLDYFIDDRPKNIEECNQYAPRCQAALLDATYNQEFNYGWRVSSFDEFASFVLNTVKQDYIYPIGGVCIK